MLTRKNTAKIGIFDKITAFRTDAGATPGNIDENRSLPYKPRQLSAMTRSDRGGSFWAGQHHRTYLIVRQIVSSSGKLSAENDP
jgi:hypothetical protein